MPMNPRLLRPLETGFNPRKIAGLALWVDFSDTASVTLDGSNKISDVLDKSGNGVNGTQGTAGNRLGISTLNGLQCADNGTASNAFCVSYARGSNTDNWREGFLAGVWDGGGSTFPATVSFFSASTTGGTANGAMMNGSNGSDVLSAGTVWHGSVGAITSINNDSVLLGSPSLLAFPAITSPFVFRGQCKDPVGVNGWQIGGDRSLAGRGWRGRIGEVVVFNRTLSDGEALLVRRYLAKKWGAPAQT